MLSIQLPVVNWAFNCEIHSKNQLISNRATDMNMLGIISVDIDNDSNIIL